MKNATSFQLLNNQTIYVIMKRYSSTTVFVTLYTRTNMFSVQYKVSIGKILLFFANTWNILLNCSNINGNEWQLKLELYSLLIFVCGYCFWFFFLSILRSKITLLGKQYQFIWLFVDQQFAMQVIKWMQYRKTENGKWVS